MEIYNEKMALLGTLTDINQYGSADIFVVKNNDKEFMFPFARNVIERVDYNEKIIIVNQQILDEMIV